jgi:hypothetical protein
LCGGPGRGILAAMPCLPFLALLALGAGSVPAANAAGTVFVEPSQTLVRQAVTVEAGSRFSYPLPLEEGVTLRVELFVDGGLTHSVAVGLLDEENFARLKAGGGHQFLAGTEHTVWRSGKYAFPVRATGTYHLLVDNGAAWWWARDVDVYAYVVYPRPTPWVLGFRQGAQDLYDALRAWFIFEDFKVTYRHCGMENAFSSPDITICLELIEALRDQGLEGAYPFVLFHELGHTLLRRWGDPRYDEEDTADEFAVMAGILLDLQVNVREAAKWFAARTVELYAGPRLWLADRHTISPLRARNILERLGAPVDVMRRWQPVLLPRMRTDYLNQLAERQAEWVDRAAIRAELQRREGR